MTDTGPGATLTNGSGSHSYSLTETGDWKSSSLSQTETGQDRYSLLQGFTNVSNAKNSTLGNLDYSPHGVPFSDDGPEEKNTADYWKKEAAKRIDLSQALEPEDLNDQMKVAIARNTRINAAYAELATKNIGNQLDFIFLGAAAFASRDVGKAMKELQKKYLEAGNSVTKGFYRKAFNYLAEGNKAVYENMYWQHLAYEHGGIQLMRKLAANGDITGREMEAWEQIAKGLDKIKKRDETGVPDIFEGNKKLFEYEQKVILPRTTFEPLHTLLRLTRGVPGLRVAARIIRAQLNSMATSPFPGGTSFRTWARNNGIKNPDITDASQRYLWGVQCFIGRYWRSTFAKSPKEVQEKLQSMRKQMQQVLIDPEKRMLKK